jgi:hypothetical protein
MRQKGKATNAELEKCAAGLDSLAQLFTNLAGVAGLLSNAVEEAMRVRTDLTKGKRSLDFKATVAEIRLTNAELANALELVKLQTFRLGKLTGYAADGENYCDLLVRRGVLEAFLTKHFGAPFSVAIRHHKS